MKEIDRTLRKLLGLTGLDAQGIADVSGADIKSVYKWMNGTSKPSAEYLLVLIQYIETYKGKSIKDIL